MLGNKLEDTPAGHASAMTPGSAPTTTAPDAIARTRIDTPPAAAVRIDERAAGWAARRRSATLRRVLALCDLTAVAAGLLVAYELGSGASTSTFLWAMAFSPMWVLVAKLNGLYDHDHRRIRHSTLDELPALVSTSVMATLAIAGLVSLSPAPTLHPGDALTMAMMAFAAAFVLRAAARNVLGRLTVAQVGLLIGSSAAAAALARKLTVHPEARLHVIGYLGDPPVDSEARDIEWLGRPSDLGRIAAWQGVERVLIAEEGVSHAEVRDAITESKGAGLSLTMVPSHGSLLGQGTELNRLGELPLLDFRFADPSRSTMVLKRGLDIVVSASILTVLAPVLLMIAILIKLDTRGPVLFKQVRIGQHGRPFRMLKFRSMVSGAEDRLREVVDLDSLEEPAFKIPNDPRVTRVGRHLRRLSLDELPQLLNVLRGDMSLVGPRPEEEAVVNLYDERQRTRLRVKPGLTGPMQVYGRGDLSFEERFALERDYMDNLSIAGDLAILLRTPRAIMRGNGAY